MKTCPYCAEEIQDAAVVCKHCGRDLKTGATAAAATPSPVIVVPETAWRPGVAAVLSLVIPGAGQMYKGQVGLGLVWLVAVVFGYMMFIVPGLILHLICIVNAASGRPRVVQGAPHAASDPRGPVVNAASDAFTGWPKIGVGSTTDKRLWMILGGVFLVLLIYSMVKPHTPPLQTPSERQIPPAAQSTPSRPQAPRFQIVSRQRYSEAMGLASKPANDPIVVSVTTSQHEDAMAIAAKVVENEAKGAKMLRVFVYSPDQQPRKDRPVHRFTWTAAAGLKQDY